MRPQNDMTAAAIFAALTTPLPMGSAFPKRRRNPSSWAVISAEIRNEDKKRKKRARISAARKQNVRRLSHDH